MIITDLDGTLLNDKAQISETNRKSLIDLGNKHIIRVAATGRSLFLVNKVLESDFPIDFLIFSSGAGIYDWKKKTLLKSHQLNSQQVEKISTIIKKQCNNLMIFETIPENHKFHYWINEKVETDFINRLNKFQLVSKIISGSFYYKDATQVMTILPEDLELFNEIQQELYKQVENIKIIRASSPIDGKSIWCEIFPDTVSKGEAVKWLCKKLNISLKNTTSIGNDYNDLDMLNITQNAFVVKNSPDELLSNSKFKIVKSNNKDGFSEAISLIYN